MSNCNLLYECTVRLIGRIPIRCDLMATESTKLRPTLDLLARAHSPNSANTIFTDKILHKPLLLRPTSPDPTSHDARDARRRKRLRAKQRAVHKQKPKPISAKQKRQLGVLEIPKEQRRYDNFEKLHELWLGYMKEVLGLDGESGHSRKVTAQGAGALLVSADYHGALMEVVRCRCVGRVGTKGIVVRDTKFTFEMITRNNALKGILKLLESGPC